MIQGAETRLDGTTLVVRIPMRFQRRGGRKRIVAPDGSELAPSSKPQPDGTLVKALARAHRWQGMLEEGRFASVRELAEAERVSLSYISRILRLTLLAPDIVERILDGCPAPRLPELMQPFPVAWERQREAVMRPNLSLDPDHAVPSHGEIKASCLRRGRHISQGSETRLEGTTLVGNIRMRSPIAS